MQKLHKESMAAAILDISVLTLRRWRWAGKPPAFVKIGGLVRYEPRTLVDLVIDGRRSSTSDTGPLEAA